MVWSFEHIPAASGWRSAVASLLLLSACAGGDVKIVEPPPTGGSTLTITITADAADAPAAQQLGWSAGIPGAEVRVAPADSTVSSSKLYTSSSSGQVTLPDVKDGFYTIDVKRALSSQELAKLGAAPDVRGFVGKASIQISAASKSATVTIPASRRRSLIFNEVSWRVLCDIGTLCYYENGFMELYNNSDTTIYLDGITIGLAMDTFRDFQNFPCSMFESLRNDPAGIWTLYHHMFPGTGHDHPLRSGALVTIAQDAIDHSVFYPGLPDLRNADFEFRGPSDVDNPVVPDMINRSYDSPPAAAGHGMFNIPSGGAFFLATPVDLNSLPRQRDPRNERVYWRFPANSILDVFSTVYDETVEATSRAQFGPLCPQLVNNAFERETGAFFGSDDKTDFKNSASRKVIGTTEDGRAILQSTRSSAVDFVKGPFSLGRL
jgi:hypothetical protein